MARTRTRLALLLAALFAPAAHGQAPVPGPYDHALVDLDRFQALGEQAVQRGSSSGATTFNLGVATNYRLFQLERATLRLGYVEFNSGPAGNRFTIPTVPLRDQAGSPDTDGDGLSDVAEFVVGSDPNDPDSDDDGVTDAAAVQAGTLTEPLLRTGLIAAVSLPGDALDVQVHDDLAVVALGDGGVALCNVFTRMNPIVIGRLDVPGRSIRVALTGARVAVVRERGGLAVLDVSDPPAARIERVVHPLQLGGEATCVAALAGIALVGLSTGDLAALELESGLVVSRVHLGPSPLVDVVVAGDAIYALDATTLHALRLEPAALAVVSSTPSPFGNTGAVPHRRLAAGGPILYAVHGLGPNSFSLADPLHPTLIADSATGFTQAGWCQLALNGSGLALAAAGTNSDLRGNDAQLYDARDPAALNALLQRFETPGDTLSVAVYGGLGYSASTEGLQVVNYTSQDRLGVAPTVSLSTNKARIDRCEEGALLRVSSSCQDDVQVRTCELFVDGAKVDTDGSFPFEQFLITPRLAERDRITVQVRVSDTGGNSRFSDPLVIELTPDASPPTVLGRVPGPDALIGAADGVVVFTSEPLAAASLPGRFVVTEAGPDRTHGTGDDVALAGAVEVRPTVRGAVFAPAAGGLPPGRYRAQLLGGITDPTGNALAPSSWTFVVYGAGSASDQDGDGLPDVLEGELGLDPANPDTDGDGLADGQEDRDLDGVPDAIEVVLGFDLTRADTDGDGVLDRDEDRELDRLPDARELALGTNPFAVDTDGDGYADVDEVTGGSDPLDPASVPVRATTTAACALNQTDPQVGAGRVLVPLTLRNDAAPEAVLGRTSAPATSVRNDH